MSSIPYNYGSYIDAKVSMTNSGTVDSGKQIQSPASAGSRGLAKTTQFTNDKTQMQLGQEAIAESMTEIRSILNRIDGVNAPVREEATIKPYISMYKGDDGKQVYDVLDKHSKSAYKTSDERLAQNFFKKNYHKLREEPVQEDAGEDEKVVDMLRKIKQHLDNHPNMSEHPSLVALDQLADDLESGDKPADYESYQPFPEADEFNIEEDEDFEEVLGPLGFPEDETELFDAEYRGRKVPLNKPMRGDVKKFKVYVKDPKSGNVKKVNFGHGGTSAKRPTMRIRKSNPKARKSFRARHNCANPGPKTKARYWSCRKW